MLVIKQQSYKEDHTIHCYVRELSRFAFARKKNRLIFCFAINIIISGFMGLPKLQIRASINPHASPAKFSAIIVMLLAYVDCLPVLKEAYSIVKYILRRSSPRATEPGRTASLTAEASESFMGVGPHAPTPHQLRIAHASLISEQTDVMSGRSLTYSVYAECCTSRSTSSRKSGRPDLSSTRLPCLTRSTAGDSIPEGRAAFSPSDSTGLLLSSVT